MKKAMIFALCVTCLLTLAIPAFAEDTYQGLYTLTMPYGFKLGAPLSAGQLWDSSYLKVVQQHFNSITTTNEMKAYSLLDERATKARKDGMPAMNYAMADNMVRWAQSHNIGVRGHVLVWDAYMTEWFFHEGFDMKKPFADPETIRARTEYYITEVVTHFETAFPGVVYCWDVVNEAVGDSAGEYAPGDPRHLRTMRSGTANLFQRYMGDDYVSLAFLYARNAVEALGADVALYYNDYNAYFPDKAAAIRALINEVNTFATNEDGSPRKLCDGIGMQGYIGGYGVQDGCLVPSHINMIKQEILNYSAMGLEVQITEMAVRNFDLKAAEQHADFYANLFKMFMGLYDGQDNPLKAVSIWGLTDTNAPKGNYVYNLNSPYGGLLDLKYQYKDAFKKVYEALTSE